MVSFWDRFFKSEYELERQRRNEENERRRQLIREEREKVINQYISSIKKEEQERIMANIEKILTLRPHEYYRMVGKRPQDFYAVGVHASGNVSPIFDDNELDFIFRNVDHYVIRDFFPAEEPIFALAREVPGEAEVVVSYWEKIYSGGFFRAHGTALIPKENGNFRR